jgi:hypothetical protein
MKQSIVFFAFLFFVSMVEINAQTYGLDNTDPVVFTKFRVPDTDLRTLWFNTNFDFNSQKNINSNDYNSYTYSSNNYYSNLRYNLNPKYFLLRESENRYLSLDAGLIGSYSRQYQENEASINQPKSTFLTKDYAADLNMSFTYDNYINGNNTFYSLSSNIRVNLDDSKSEQNYNTITNSYSSNKNQNYTVSVGAGIGRLRNITPVVTAIRFQERLKQLNLLNNDLSENTIESLAGQFYKQQYFSDVYDRPDKYLWQDIEKTLTAEGVSLKGMNMYSDSYLKEAVNEVRFLRNEGLIAGVELQLNYEKQYRYSTGSSNILPEMFYTLGNVYLKYSHQMNLNSQFNFDIAASGGPNILKNPSFRQQYSLLADIGYNYELTDRLVVSVNNSISLAFWNDRQQLKNRTNDFVFSLHYFIEDNLSLNANYHWNYNDSKSMVLNEPVYYQNSSGNNHSVSIGFTYYVERGFLIN